jgi:hypothetical protein
MDTLDLKNGLLGVDINLYLSLIQFINTKNLRSYIGLSEETFQRINHSFYHLYRMKFNGVPIRKLAEILEGSLCFERTIINTGFVKLFGNHLVAFILKESIFESRLQRYNGEAVGIFEMKLIYIPEFSSHERESSYPIKIAKGIQYLIDNGWGRDICTVTISSHLCSKPGENVLTVILNMNKDSSCYFKFNGTTLKKAVRNILHIKKRIEVAIDDCKQVTLIHTIHLKQLPIDLSENYTYYDANTGKKIKND